MPRRQFTNLRKVIELELLQPVNRERVQLILTLLDDENFKIFSEEKITLIEKSENDYIGEYEQYPIQCLVNEPVSLSECFRIHEVIAVADDGESISCKYVCLNEKLYVGYKAMPVYTEQLPILFSIDDVLVEKKALEYLINKFQADSRSPNRPSQPVSIHEEREEALKAYLKARCFGLDSLTSLQAMYEKIGAPNKHELWTQLSSVHLQLFRSGKDDFFKRNIFKEGTAEHQLTLTVKTGGRPPK